MEEKERRLAWGPLDLAPKPGSAPGVYRGLGQVPLLVWASIPPSFRGEVEMRGRGSVARSRAEGQRGLIASAHHRAGRKNTKSCRPTQSSLTAERAGRPPDGTSLNEARQSRRKKSHPCQEGFISA